MSNSATVLRSVPPGKQPRNPISRKQVERVLSRSVGAFGIVYGLQTLPVFLSQAGEAQSWWVIAAALATFGSLFIMFVMSIVYRGIRFWHGFSSIAYLCVLVSWPLAVIDPTSVTRDNHWLYFLLTVATATAIISFSTRIATAYLFVSCIVYGVIRVTPAGGGATWQGAALDSVYAIILGGALIIIATMLRQAASSVDNSQAMALDRYGNAVRQHAMEVERVQVDAIVHDSVLTTLLSAARAYTPQSQALSATMARNAMRHLKDAAKITPDDGSTVKIAALARRITDTAMEMSPNITLRTKNVGALSIPVLAAETLYSASVQAMVNSLQHGGSDPEIGRWLRIHPTSTGGIDIEVGDNGSGFDVSAMSTERLGVRVSIIERVANAGGFAEIASEPGVGTVVSITWPHMLAHSAPDFDELAAEAAQPDEEVRS